MRVWKIDPNKTAMENLWDAVSVAVKYFIKDYKRRIFMTDDEWDDFAQTVKFNSVRSFLLNKVGPRSSYSRNHCFYQNVYSVVWSRFYRDLYYYQKAFVKSKMSSIDRICNLMHIEGADGESIIEYDIKPMPKYVRSGERSLARQDLASWLRGPTCTNGLKFREQELADEIEEARLELFGEDYKPTDWKALREKRASLRAERLKNENTDSDSGEGKTEGVHPDGRVLPGKRRRRGTKPVPKIKHRA